MSCDFILKGARLVDPVNNRDGIFDIAIVGNKIVAVSDEINDTQAKEIINLNGYLAMPGVIDGHVHVSNWSGGSVGYKMMVKAGTVTAIDFAGPIQDILNDAPVKGCGINIGGLEAFWPGHNISSNNPSWEELQDFVQVALAKGALGIKILGGHFPMTPDATARAIEIANQEGAYVAFHVGTSTMPRSDLNSLQQAIEIADGRRFHMCHVCTCCLGLVLGDPLAELKVMMEVLESNPNVVSESHLSPIAYTFAEFENGKPISLSTQMFLEMAGYGVSEEGLRVAMDKGYSGVLVEQIDSNVYMTGSEGFLLWKSGKTNTLGFMGNLPISLFVCAIHRNTDGAFTVDALATDGGGIPRNNLLTSGTALVRFGAMTFTDLVTKVAVAPARMYGLINKGHLGPGADADVTVINPENGEAFFAMASGKVILQENELRGSGAQFVTTERISTSPRGVHTIKVPPFKNPPEECNTKA